jgi:ribosomal protein S18 acetylase RimI-like enzyme
MVFVRRALRPDLDAAARLFSGYLAFYGRSHSAEAARAFVADRLAAGDSLVYLAFDGDDHGTAVGIAQIYPTFSSLSLAPAWVLNDLFVDPKARGTGAGRELLRTVAREAAEAGAAYVALETADDNVPAQRLYEAEGFVRETGFRHYARSTRP